MSYELYFDERKNWRPEKLLLITQAQNILEEYAAAGYVLTLRQLYYQFVSRNYISNTEKSYKRLGEIIGDARMNGDIDWAAIEDRGRNLRSVTHWESPEEIIQNSAYGYHRDKWEKQPRIVEVWVEKEALLGVFERICYQLDIPVFACKGYTSLSEMKVAGDRISERYDDRGQDTVILHFGDHDPSGIDMTRDIQDRLDIFTYHEGLVEVDRLALTMAQVIEWNPPPNPAKTTDSRFEGYMRRFGHESWELDALRPQVLSDLVEEQVDNYRDPDLWEEALAQEKEEKSLLEKCAKNWKRIATRLKKQK
jgi:hypothetical protein